MRLYEEVQEFHVHILVDTSASMVTPFGDKRLSALRLAVALAYLGLIGQHRVSLYRMADRIIEGLPPQKGQGNIQRIIDYAKRLEFGGMTDLNRCFSSFRPSRQRYGIIFVISDLYGRDADEAKDAVQRIASWPGEAHVIQIFNPWEEHPDLDGEVELIDVETQEHRKLWFTKRELKRYEEVFDLFLKTVEHTCKSRQIDYQRWCTDQPFEEAFLDLLSRGSALASGA